MPDIHNVPGNFPKCTVKIFRVVTLFQLLPVVRILGPPPTINNTQRSIEFVKPAGLGGYPTGRNDHTQ